ncbi:MAG TPA: polyprenyl synthetase family protein [Polyangia bacterium]
MVVSPRFEPMESESRIEAVLEQIVTKATAAPCPVHLAEAIRYAVFPGGGRVRPGLCLAVAKACGDREPALADAAAVAVELLHCASLVQDDLPCFDDAPLRRGQPSLHMRFGEAIAILVGDALIVMAFGAVSAHVHEGEQAAACAQILRTLAEAAGTPAGIAAGQAWESEPSVDVVAYHHAKTAALFEAAAVAGAIAGGGKPEGWRQAGVSLGAAYQIADDLADALGESGTLGKPIHQDGNKARPSVVASLGVDGAIKQLDQWLGQAKQSIPECSGRGNVEEFLNIAAARLCPPALRQKDFTTESTENAEGAE